MLNAANEVGVESFLAKKIGFLQICPLVERTLEAYNGEAVGSVEEVESVDAWARAEARVIVAEMGH